MLCRHRRCRPGRCCASLVGAPTRRLAVVNHHCGLATACRATSQLLPLWRRLAVLNQGRRRWWCCLLRMLLRWCRPFRRVCYDCYPPARAGTARLHAARAACKSRRRARCLRSGGGSWPEAERILIRLHPLHCTLPAARLP